MNTEYGDNNSITAWREGVVVESYSSGPFANQVFEYGDHNYTLVLTRSTYMQFQPKEGKHRDAISFAVGSRIQFKRANDSIVEYKLMGTYNFNHARCLRGIHDHHDQCFVDLLRLRIFLKGQGSFVSPGCAFIASIHYHLEDTEFENKKIKWYLQSIYQLSFESIKFDFCPWPKRGITTYMPEPDYNRKLEPLTYHPTSIAVYLGNFRFYTNREGMQRARMGQHILNCQLKVGRMYLTQLFESRLSMDVYTIGIRPLEWRHIKDLDYKLFRKQAQFCTTIDFEEDPEIEGEMFPAPDMSLYISKKKTSNGFGK